MGRPGTAKFIINGLEGISVECRGYLGRVASAFEKRLCGSVEEWWLKGLTWDFAVLRVRGKGSMCVRISRTVFYVRWMWFQSVPCQSVPWVFFFYKLGVQFLDGGCDAWNFLIWCFCECFLGLRVFEEFRVVQFVRRRWLRRGFESTGGWGGQVQVEVDGHIICHTGERELQSTSHFWIRGTWCLAIRL